MRLKKQGGASRMCPACKAEIAGYAYAQISPGIFGARSLAEILSGIL
jgi:hypothetical protein